MPDVPDDTIEAEQDLDYTYGYDYDYGLLDGDLRTIARAVATTEANTLAVGSGSATSTATAATEATTQAIGSGSTTATADAQTTASTTVTATTAVQSVAQATTTATTRVTDATFEQPQVEWRVTRDGTHVEDAVFDVDPVVDTANPFGDFTVIKMDDSEGERFEEYARGTRVDVAVSENAGITFEGRFTGYVVERRETEQSGADVLEVEAYSFDQFLRRNTVTNDQRGNTITEALADIIQTDTPVTFDPALVEVGDDQELTRTYQGEAVETVLRDLAFKSNNEDFGVNDDLEFFFRERETTHIDRGIDNTQWFNYDIPELGKEAINEVEVWFDDGDESVIVDDGTDKLDLQDSLGLPDPGTQRAELNRPLITDINDAEDEGRKYLTFRNATLSGTVTTFGLFDARPGDTIDIEIAPRGIDDEFVIAAVEYRWGVDETILTIVEKRGDVDDILSELNESVQRVEMEGADRDAPKNRITTTDAAAVIQSEFEFDVSTPDDARIVNDGRRLLRDAWTGDSVPAIDEVVVGDDNSNLSRSNSDLENQIESFAVTPELVGDTSVRVSAEILGVTYSEIGLKAGGTLLFRGVLNDAVESGIIGTGEDNFAVTLTVANDDSVSRGVLTTDGQTAVRDILAGNDPTLPNAYAYGDDDTEVSESDTALGNQLVEVSLDEILIQDADTQADWEGIFDAGPDDLPVQIANGQVEMTQISFFVEGENFNLGQTGFNDGSPDTDISNDDYASFSRGPELDTGPDFAEWDFVVNHTIPGEEFGIFVRQATNDEGAPEFEITLEHANGESYTLDENVSTGAALQQEFSWSELPFFAGAATFEEPADLEKGTTHTIRLEVTNSNGNAEQFQYWVDGLAPIDKRYESEITFGETTDANDALSGPENFPELITRALDTATTRRNIDEANFVSTWNDTSNAQFVELANDGSTFTRFNNTDSASVTFASLDTGVDTNLGISRFTNDPTSTPSEGDTSQAIQDWQLFANPDAIFTDDVAVTLTRGIVPPDTLAAGTTLREAGLKSDETLLTRHELAAFDLLEGQRVSSSESTTFTGEN